MKSEHNHLHITLKAPLSEILALCLGQPGITLSYPEWEDTYERKDLPQLDIPHYKHMGQKHPLSTIYHSTLREYNPIAKYNHLVEQRVSPCVASGLLPLGTLASVDVSALQSVWESLVKEKKVKGEQSTLINQIEEALAAHKGLLE